MAKHGKQKNTTATFKVVCIIIGAIAVLLCLIALSAHFGWMDKIASAFSSNETTVTETEPTVPTTTVRTEEKPQYRTPESMKGVWLRPGVDYYLSEKDTAATVKKQLDTALASVKEWGFNTLILPMNKENTLLYPSGVGTSLSLTDENGTFDPLLYVLKYARNENLYVYGVIDLKIGDMTYGDTRTLMGRHNIMKMVKEAIAAEPFDGFYISNFVCSDEQVAADRSACIAGLNELMRTISKTVKAYNNDLHLGLLSNGVWAHNSVEPLGSKTAEYFEEYTDGAADTREWMSTGLFSCLMVQDQNSTAHPTASFNAILQWWDAFAEQYDRPLYISHSASSIGSYKTGWNATDQLAQQYLYCRDAAFWKGSAYDSLSALVNDKSGAADALKKAYEGVLDEEFIYKQLTVSSPARSTFLTEESSVTFQGGGDTNFPLTINNKEIQLTEHGFFTENYPLSIGVNTFVFSHKGTKKTYKVTYKQTLLQKVSPDTSMTVEGDNKFVITAVARKGSVVSAKLGSQTVKLTAVGSKGEDDAQQNTDFQNYSGSLVLPKGTVGQAKSLGNVSVTATYNGFSETKNGGKITLNALPRPTTAPPTSSTGGSPTAKPPAGNQKIVVITADYAETFSGGDLTDDYSRPYNSYLPQGTMDTLKANVYNGSFSYYLLGSDKRVYMKDAKVITAAELKAQELKNGKMAIKNAHTVFTFETDWAIPVYIAAAPQKYYRETTTTEPHYGLEKYAQTATYVEVTFHYVTKVPELPDFSDNPLFKSGSWNKIDGSTYVLHLDLRKTGGFYGYSLKWNGKTLTLSFLNPADVSQNAASEKLKGIRILLDPGHGSPDDKPAEGPFNLTYANIIKQKLEALGATVVMTRTTALNTKLTLESRAQMAHNKEYHLFISVHMNGANGKATGATTWYYSEYGYTISKFIYPLLHEVEAPYGVGVGEHARASGTNWGTLYVNRTIFDCPSVLIECAFLDNPHDKECLIDPVYRDKLTQAIVNGVVNYFSAL